MSGSKLKQEIYSYSHHINFYKLGLIRKYLKKRRIDYENCKLKILDLSKCPKCNSNNIHFDVISLYSVDKLVCTKCGNEFIDDIGYINAVSELDCFPFTDRIITEIYTGAPNIYCNEWQRFCERVMCEYLGINVKKNLIPREEYLQLTLEKALIKIISNDKKAIDEQINIFINCGISENMHNDMNREIIKSNSIDRIIKLEYLMGQLIYISNSKKYESLSQWLRETEDALFI